MQPEHVPSRERVPSVLNWVFNDSTDAGSDTLRVPRSLTPRTCVLRCIFTDARQHCFGLVVVHAYTHRCSSVAITRTGG